MAKSTLTKDQLDEVKVEMVVNKRERDSDDVQDSDPDVVKEEMARRTRPREPVDYKEEEESDDGGSDGGKDSGSEVTLDC
jgi:hypothetical protein